MILPIVIYGDPVLRVDCPPVTDVTEETRTLAENMVETMYEADGVGLAATQVDVHKRLVVIDTSEDRNDPLVFANPEITVLDGGMHEGREGCLSVPGFYEPVIRPEHILVRAQDRRGKAFELRPEGLLAVCIQHELDHLNGKLFVDYISVLKRQRIRSKLEKQHRQPA